jgi:hypothetical protein
MLNAQCSMMVKRFNAPPLSVECAGALSAPNSRSIEKTVPKNFSKKWGWGHGAENPRTKKVLAVFMIGKSSDTAVSIAELLTEDSGRFYAKKTAENFLEEFALLKAQIPVRGLSAPMYFVAICGKI